MSYNMRVVQNMVSFAGDNLHRVSNVATNINPDLELYYGSAHSVNRVEAADLNEVKGVQKIMMRLIKFSLLMVVSCQILSIICGCIQFENFHCRRTENVSTTANMTALKNSNF